MTKLLRAGKVATPITLKTYLPDLDLGGVTVPQYLVRLAANATTIINAAEYGRTIHELALRRNLITIGEDMVNRAFEAPVDETPRQQIEDAERKLYSLADPAGSRADFRASRRRSHMAIYMAGEAYKRDGGLSGTATGLVDFDQKLGGLQRSDLAILAGRPGDGKSALANEHRLQYREGLARRTPGGWTLKTVNGGIVGIFNLEMSAEQLATRIIAEQSGIPSFKIRRGDITQDEFGRLHEAVAEMQSIPLYIDQTGGISIAQLTARARRLKRQHGLDLLVVDYLQLLTGASRKGENRVQELTEITTGLKALAKELDVPVIALPASFHARSSNGTTSARNCPILRESGSIEQDADVVLFIYREEYYLQNREPKPGTEEHLKWQTEMDRVHGKAEVIIGKQRHGPTGSVQLQFEANITKFSTLAKEDYLPERLE